MKRTIILGLATILAACDNGSNDGKGGAGGNDAASTGAKASTSSSSTGAAMSAQQPFTAGSRLKVRTLTSDDGAKQQLGFFDNEIGVACNFGLATDGTQRCFPLSSATVTTNLFGDNSCTIPIAVSQCADMPMFARASVGTCGASEAYQVLGVHAGGIFVKSGATCSMSTLTEYTAFSVGPVVPASTWMKATEAVE